MRRYRHGRICALAIGAIVCCAAIAGCGDDVDKASYEREVRSVGKQLELTMDAIKGDGITDPDQLAAAETALQESVDSLGAIDAPNEVRSAHDDYRRGLESMAAMVKEIRALSDGRTAKPAQAYAVVERYATGKESFATLLARAQKRYRDKGYDVFADES